MNNSNQPTPATVSHGTTTDAGLTDQERIALELRVPDRLEQARLQCRFANEYVLPYNEWSNRYLVDVRDLQAELCAARAELARVTALREAALVLHGAAYNLLASPLTQPQWESLPQPFRDAMLTLEYKVDALTLAQASERAAGSGEGDDGR